MTSPKIHCGTCGRWFDDARAYDAAHHKDLATGERRCLDAGGGTIVAWQAKMRTTPRLPFAMRYPRITIDRDTSSISEGQEKV